MLGPEERVAIVNEHVRLENAHQFPACIGEFGRPRYEVVADGDVFDGADRVNQFLSQNKTAFPDFVFTASRITPAEDGTVLVEGHFVGTQLGTWRGLPPTGRTVDCPMCVLFEFDGDHMVNEKIYFDINTPLRQLGAAFNPDGLAFKLVTALTHPITITKAVVRMIFTRSKPAASA